MKKMQRRVVSNLNSEKGVVSLARSPHRPVALKTIRSNHCLQRTAGAAAEAGR